ncbi:Annexin 1 [Spironucleus salmonicida]|uniref:Annexin 1 n=1 Tax=Spironucleus salmonicida TaxID=348837 RepID=V6LC14_9EUKA|nr:Annexin 1 [Spironucleus salmonicida]|eukprot:EST42007.1 Annexin 1 [Spironucleus salmonicida]
MADRKAKWVQHATTIQKACNGMGTDEKAIIDVIAACTPDDCAGVSQAYYCCYGKDVVKLLQKETSGTFDKFLTACFTKRYQLWVQLLKEAIKGLGTDEKSLCELIIMGTTTDMEILQKEYFRLYKKEMIEEISDDISNKAPWAKLIKAWMYQTRFTRNSIAQDVDTLKQAMKGAGTDEQAIIRILTTSTPAEFVQIAEAYEKTTGKPLREHLKKELSGKSEYAFCLAHDVLICPSKAAAFVIHKAIKGAGTNEKTIINFTALYRDRCTDINTQYTKYGSLAKDIKGDFSSHMEKALLAIWKAQ